MVERALRGVVRETLSTVAARKTLPGEHHFFITFSTQADGVKIPDYLRRQYPDEMTIVLQYQFYDLSVDDDILKVTLSFNNKLEPLVIPLDAITTFADPAVSFALQFQTGALEDADFDDEDGTTSDDSTAGMLRETEPKGTAEVVTLDAFRKKPQE